MKKILQYVYYRIAKTYKTIFGIDKYGDFLIQSYHSWGMFVLLMALCCYLLSLEAVVLWRFGVKIKVIHVIITVIPFALIYIFSEDIFGNDKEQFKLLEKKHKDDKHTLVKGILIGLFVGLSLPCYLTTLYLCLK